MRRMAIGPPTKPHGSEAVSAILQGTFNEDRMPEAERLTATLRRMWMLVRGETKLWAGASLFMVSGHGQAEGSEQPGPAMELGVRAASRRGHACHAVQARPCVSRPDLTRCAAA